MAVLKQTSPTAWPTAPSPVPSNTVPSASTRRAVARGSVQPFVSCLAVIGGLHSRPLCRRQRGWLWIGSRSRLVFPHGVLVRGSRAPREDQRLRESCDEGAGQSAPRDAASHERGDQERRYRGRA